MAALIDIGRPLRELDQQLLRVFCSHIAVGFENVVLYSQLPDQAYNESAAIGSELLLDAQIALKRAKQQHRGSSQCFSSIMGSDARERFKLLKGLRADFEENRLFVVYQPQVDLATKKAIGAEALLRWRNEDGKFVPPDQFIPLAEHSGLIIAIGEFVLRAACLQLKRMLELGHSDFRMCVNIALAQFRHPAFISSVSAALRDTGVDGQNLELEITESMAMEDTELVLHLLADIKRLRATVAIDDFGTGYSSLSHLRQLDVERLKIDLAFLREAQSSTAGSHHEGQSYLFARPMQADQLQRWMETGLGSGND